MELQKLPARHLRSALPTRSAIRPVVCSRQLVKIYAVAQSIAPGASESNSSYNGNSSVAAAVAAAVAPAAQVAVPQISFPEPIPGLQPPPKVYAAAVAAGQAKASMPAGKILVSSVLGGAFIALGGAAAYAVGGACPGLAASNPGLQKMVMGVFGLPTALTMVLVCGAELFTGNTALVTCAVLEKKASWSQLVKSWLVSYLGNAIGCALVVALLAASGVAAPLAAPLAVAKAKTSLTFAQAFLRGVLCNWMVCLAIWQALTSTTFPGKFLAAALPVSAFVAIGLEHSVANMFMVPMGIALGAPVSLATFVTSNLVPVTLGNIVGGAVCVALAFSYIYGSLGKPKAA